MKKIILRPHPYTAENEIINIIHKKITSSNKYKITKFKFWRVENYFKKKKFCDYILLHWPESLWRSNNILKVLIKLVYFIFIYFLSSMRGYKWCWIVHNIKPHTNVRSEFLEKIMRKFLAKFFHINFFLDIQSKIEFENKVTKINNKIVYIHHPLYDNIRNITKHFELRRKLEKKNKKNKKTLRVLSINLLSRKKKIGTNFIKFWEKNFNNQKYQLVVTGAKKNFVKDNIIYLKGFLSDKNLKKEIFLTDVLLITQKEITNSGQLFLAMTYPTRIICWKNNFFKENDLNHQCIMSNNLLSVHNFKKSLDKVYKRDFFSNINQYKYIKNLSNLNLALFLKKFNTAFNDQ